MSAGVAGGRTIGAWRERFREACEGTRVSGKDCAALAAMLDNLSAERIADAQRIMALESALRSLVERCDGDECVRADGSNIDTLAAHVALGDMAPDGVS